MDSQVVSCKTMTRCSAVVIDLNSSELSESEKECGGEEHDKQDYFQMLPDSLLLRILSHLPARALINSSSVSQRWRNLSRDSSLWRCPKLYFLNVDAFCSSENNCRELFRLLKYAPCDKFDRVEVSFGPTDPSSLQDALIMDTRKIRSLCIAFSAGESEKVVALLKRLRLTLEELQIMAYAKRGLTDPDVNQLGIWREINEMKALKSLSVSKRLEPSLMLANKSGLEELRLESCTEIDAAFFVLRNSDSLRTLVVVGDVSRALWENLYTIGSCRNLRAVTLPCIKDFTFLEECHQLTHLGIVEGPFCDSFVASFLKKSVLSKRLISLELTRVDGCVFSAISSQTMPCLRSLSIRKCCNVSCFDQVLKDTYLLEEISFTYSFFNVNEVQLIRPLRDSMLVPRLKVLRLNGGCGMGPDGLFQLCLHKECLTVRQNRPKLTAFLCEGCFCRQRDDDKEVRNRISYSLLQTMQKLFRIRETLAKPLAD